MTTFSYFATLPCNQRRHPALTLVGHTYRDGAAGCSKIETGTPVTFSRFGDVEWSAVIGVDGENCDGHTYSKGLQEGLRKALLSEPQYDLGMQKFALKNRFFEDFNG